MKKIYTVRKSVAQAATDLTAALAARNFGVLHVHDLKKTLNGKGVPFDAECRIFEVCNPHQAARVLADDMDLNMALPCRVSVYEKDGKAYIGMLSPKAMLEQLSDAASLGKVADEVESVLEEAIREVAG